MDSIGTTQPGKEFKPSPQLKTLYHIYLSIVSAIVVLPLYVLLLADGEVAASLAAVPSVVLTVGFLVYWIRRFYDSISYTLAKTEVVWRRGVWFKNTGIVPYSRITNVDIAQGPISRSLGIAALKVQTAGYSGERKAEIKLEGIENSEELREFIMGLVRGQQPPATENHVRGEGVDVEILRELRKIRELVERVIGRVIKEEC